MKISDVFNQGKESLDQLAFEIATAFPHSNDVAHTGIIGTIPFLAGKYGAELLGKRIPELKKYSTAIGFGSSALAELLWQGFEEPNSSYDNPGDKLSDYKGMAETLLGSLIAYGGTKITGLINRKD